MEIWTGREAAKHCGIAESTWRDYVSDQRAPAALPWRDDQGRRLWRADAVREWHANRPGRGARTDLKGRG